MGAQEEPLRIALKFVAEPARYFLGAPPVLIASLHAIDFTCGRCSAVLMHADKGQVHDLVIRCTLCGGFNSTDC